MVEKVRLPEIPGELTANTPDATTKISQYPDGRTVVHSVRQGVEGHLVFHSDGSFKYNSNTGSTVEFAANNALHYAKGGVTLSIDNNNDVKISGHHRINIDTDAHIEVAKNASIAVNGMAEVHSTGHVKFSAADIYLGATKGSVVINAARDIEMTSTKGRFTLHSSGVQTFTTDSGDFHVNTAGEIDLNSQLDTQINSQGKITTQSQSDTNINSKADITSLADNNNNIKAKGHVTTESDGNTLLEGGGMVFPPLTITAGAGV